MTSVRRPRDSKLDWHLIDSLCGLEASEAYVAERVLVGEGRPVNKTSIESTVKYLGRRIRAEHDMTYVQYCQKRMEHWRLTLKQKMRKTAVEDGNVTMQIFLSKQDLGYSDKVEEKRTEKSEQSVVVYQSEWAKEAKKPTNE